MFDVNNEQCYRTLWTQDDVIHHKDFTLKLENSFDAAAGRACSVVTLTPHGGGEAMSEVVEEQLFAAAEIHQALEHAGFRVCLSEDFSFPDVPEAGRVKSWWVAKAISGRGKKSVAAARKV